ncbi:MAG TPA: hypothetical protein VHC18_10430 [Amycolatopsis sp.]|nr:hypothetical protein [Amycolatopsis sp.]
MSTETDGDTASQSPSTVTPAEPPAVPCTVVWSQGRPYVLEPGHGNPRWMGTDTRGRPLALTGADLRRRGWSYHR